MEDQSIFIVGDPIARPEPRAKIIRGKPVVYRASARGLIEWKENIESVIQDSVLEKQIDMNAACFLRLSFTIRRPRSHYVNNSCVGELRNSAPDSTKIDRQMRNLAEPVIDQLVKSKIIVSESSIVSLHVSAKWGSESGCFLRIGGI